VQETIYSSNADWFKKNITTDKKTRSKSIQFSLSPFLFYLFAKK
jgi:hypothetical protein